MTGIGLPAAAGAGLAYPAGCERDPRPGGRDRGRDQGTRRACRAGLCGRARRTDAHGARGRCPGAEVLDGRGEDIPLPDASVDAVVISAAWHWLDPERAVPEITRVLRVGGTLGVIWISRDDRVPWVAEFNALARESRQGDRPRERSPGRRRREVTFPPGTPMSPPEERQVEFSLPMTAEQLAGLLGTYSGVITLDPERRADFSRRVRTFLDRQPWDQVDLPMICRCLRSTRLPGYP